MIAKITVGNGLRGAVTYDLTPKKGEPNRAEWIAGTLGGVGATPRQISRQGGLLRSLRPEIKNPIWRCSLSLPPSDGRRDGSFWKKIVEEFLTEMEIPLDAGWMAVQHNDQDHDHIHLSVVRVMPDSTLWSRANDLPKAVKATQKLEQRHGLSAHSREKPKQSSPNLADRQISKRKYQPMPKPFVQNQIDSIFSEHKNGLPFEKLQELLAPEGIALDEKRTKSGKLQGLSFKCQGVAFPASALGTEYSTSGLIKRGLIIQDQLEILKDEPVQKTELKPASKMPAMLKPMILPAQYGAKQIKPHAAHQTEVRLDAEKYNTQVVNLQIGPASKVMLLIGGLLAQVSVFLIQKILAFLKRLLAAFGFGMRQSDLQKYEHADPTAPALCYEPTQLALPAPKSAEDKCAEELFRVAESLEKNDPDLLPVIEGEEIEIARAEVVAAMMVKSDVNPAASTSAETENLDFLSDDFSTEPVQKPTESHPQSQTQAAGDALTQLKSAKDDLVSANKARDAAERDRPGMFVYFDTRDERRADLTKINNWLDESKSKFADWKAKNKFKFLVGSSQKDELEGEIFHLEKLKKTAEIELKKAEEADEKAEKFYRSLPAGVVPADIFNRINRASAEIRIARKSLQDEAQTLLNQLKADPMLGRQTAEIKRQIESNFKNYLASGVVSNVDFLSLSNQILELRRLKVAQENARLASMVDQESDKPVIDGQTVK